MARKRHGPSPWFIALAVPLMAAAAGPETFEVALWANDDRVETMAEVLATESHACGATAVVRLARMPPHVDDEGALGTELVVETGNSGAEARRWSVPVDYQPLALRGSELLVDHRGQRLWIDTDGSLRRESSTATLQPATAATCPTVRAHPQSAYALCAGFPDLETGSIRLLQYETPCT